MKPKRETRIWESQEIEFLIKHYKNGKGIAKCKKALNRSSASLFNKATRLKITDKKIHKHQFIPCFFWNQTKKNCRAREYNLNITIDDIWSQFLRQEGKCALTGRDLKFAPSRKDNTASLDRIDSSKHYELDNIQIVHKDVNTMKMDLSDRDFFFFCKEVYFNLKETFEL